MRHRLPAVLLALVLPLAGCAHAPVQVGAGAAYVASLVGNIQGADAPYTSAEAVSLGGGAGVDWVPTKAAQTRSLYIGTGGAVKVDLPGATGVTLTSVPVGELRLSVTKVYSTADGTTAAAITALY